MHLTEINIYPIKGLGQISLSESVVEPRGLQFDRRWMLADPTGRFLTQREMPEFTHFGAAIRPPFLEVFLKKNPSEKVDIPLFPKANQLQKINATIWESKCSARIMPDEINRWFSEKLNADLRLLWMPTTTRRRTDPKFAVGHVVSFADGYPILIAGEASLADLNSRLAEPVPMNRFRPNLVFAGGEPFFEEKLVDFSIGNCQFRGVKDCGRCIVITTDQDSGVRSAEPLRTLSKYKKIGNRVIFGQNLVWMGGDGGEKVRVGDVLKF